MSDGYEQHKSNLYIAQLEAELQQARETIMELTAKLEANQRFLLRPHHYDEDGFCACGAVEADESYQTIECTRDAPGAGTGEGQ